MSDSQSIKAVAKYIRMSPQKIRRVLDQIRGRSYQEALMILEFLPYNATGPVWQVVHSAAANAKHNYGLDKKNLIVDEIFAESRKWSNLEVIRFQGVVELKVKVKVTEDQKHFSRFSSYLVKKFYLSVSNDH